MLIRSEQKCKPHENAGRVFLMSVMWAILQMEMTSDFTKKWVGVGKQGILSSPLYVANTMLIMCPLRLSMYLYD